MALFFYQFTPLYGHNRNHVLPVTEMSGAVIEQLQCSTAFGKITVVYGHIDENGPAVRKWLDRKMPFTDKMVKNGRLSVNLSEILACRPE